MDPNQLSSLFNNSGKSYALLLDVALADTAIKAATHYCEFMHLKFQNTLLHVKLT